jgi:hypothetical protein
MKAYGGVDVWLHAFLTSALNEAEWSASRLGHLTSRERALDAHLTGGKVRLRAGLDAVAKRKNYSPCREWNPGRPARSLVSVLTEYIPVAVVKHWTALL